MTAEMRRQCAATTAAGDRDAPNAVQRRASFAVWGGGRTRRWRVLLCFAPLACGRGLKLSASTLGPAVRKYLRVSTPESSSSTSRSLTARAGRRVLIKTSRSKAAGSRHLGGRGSSTERGTTTTVLDLRGYSVMPGIVGMHNHLWYLARPNLAADFSYEGPTLFRRDAVLGAAPLSRERRDDHADGGQRRALHGSEAQARYRVRHASRVLTWMSRVHTSTVRATRVSQIRKLTGPEDARQTVAFWADRGVTSFKAYTHITREELRAAVKEAHKRGLKVTGHLCSVTYEEAIDAGIDNLEHGFFVNTELDPDKKPDTCSASAGRLHARAHDRPTAPRRSD